MRNGSRSCCLIPWLAGLTLVLGGCATGGRGGADRASLDDVAWLTGMWIEEKPGRMTVETWSAPRDAEGSETGAWMVGLNVQTRGGRPVFHEYLRLVEDAEGVVYIAAPLGRDPGTRFRLIERTESRLVFENPDHDFPRQIIYKRVRRPGCADQLRAQVEGEQNGQPSSAEWLFTRERDG